MIAAFGAVPGAFRAAIRLLVELMPKDMRRSDRVSILGIETTQLVKRMKNTIRGLAIQTICAAVLAVSAASWAAAATEAQFQEAHEQFLKANAGDKDAVEQAVSKFGELVKAEPANPLLLVYFGTATSMQSRHTMMPWKKISYAEDGMALQDKALGLLTAAQEKERSNGTPVSLLVKFTAANTFLAVPPFFNRGDQGTKLMNEVLGSSMFEESPLPFKAGVWMRVAKTAVDKKKPDEARPYLDLVIKSNAPQSDAAKKLLASL